MCYSVVQFFCIFWCIVYFLISLCHLIGSLHHLWNDLMILFLLQRVMPDYFLVLLRFYMRVDGVLIRVNDTRLFYEVSIFAHCWPVNISALGHLISYYHL